jgi:tRNA-2-methylthio-N6-dimethylallyladenosine synthase
MLKYANLLNFIMNNQQAQAYYIKTYGCQMNKADSERIASDLEGRGFVLAPSWKKSNLIIINTCSVRKRVEDRIRDFIHKIKESYQQKQQSKPKIILTGCMIHHGAEKLLQMEPAIDEVLDIGEIGFNIQPKRTDKNHAFVPISTGCNSFCTYCIVPFARGREKSRPMDEIIAEVKNLANSGYNEVTLLGQNVNSWGLEKVGVSLRKMLMSDDKFQRQNLPSNQSQYLKPKGTPPFVKLLQKVSQIKNIKKIRFMSANPWDFYDELIEEIGSNKKIDRYIHLPIQSGSNSVLKRMNRGYTTQNYLEIVKKLRRADPKIILGTDLIVGFPGETREEFQETVALAKKIGWQVAFINKYSPRPRTAADKLYKDDVSVQTKTKRWQILEEIINRPHLKHRPKIV